MSVFTVRVELHKAEGDEYTKLHEEMEKEGFSRRVRNDTGTYALPTAEYSMIAVLTGQQVLKKAESAANRVQPKPQPSILVTISEVGRVFSGLTKI